MISQTDATGNTESTITDYQNSVIALLNPSTIHDPLSTAFAYDPFGKLRYTNNSDTPQTLGWLGRQYDKETDNNYLINRYYNADRGSFLSPDRYQYVNNAIPFTWNLYQYGYANPLVNVDPEGLKSRKINGQEYQLVPVSGTDELFPIHQGYYDILKNLIGTNGGSITILDNNGKEHEIRFTKQELQKQQGAIVLFESRFLSLYGEKRGLDYVQITQGLANASAAITAGGALAWGLGEYGLAEPMANGSKRLVRRMFNRQTLVKGARAGSISVGFDFSASLGLNMLANHGNIDKSMSEIDPGDLLVSFCTGYLTAPLATEKKVYDIFSFGVLNVIDKYVKSKVGSETYRYTGGQGVFDFETGLFWKLVQLSRIEKAQTSMVAKSLKHTFNNMRKRSLSHLRSVVRTLNMQQAEKAWKTYGNQLPDILELKTYKKLLDLYIRPKAQAVRAE
ncbi:MAG: RHS repeat-associated core domain-containing protein [Acidobacteria bacterium]|nr:RHS repeat-associated core domain-containing protein [Acidobacteriota bacterium]